MPGDRPGSAEDDVSAAVRAELDRLAPGPVAGAPSAGAPSADGLGVAVSGGGDSVALLLIARRWAAERGRRLAAATVDHGLRPESAAEAEGVAALCRRLGVPHATLRAGGIREAGGNLSAAAREARLELLGGWAAREGLAAVLLGHTLDDQAETVLLRLARGSGAEGLAGMEAAVRLHGTLWLRPLMGQRREALRRLLAAEGVAWADDPSNEDPAYDRVRARRALEALAPLGIDATGLARTAGRLARQRRVLERAMRDLADRARTWGELGEARLDTARMGADEPDTAMRLLADTLMRVAGAPYRPRFEPLSAVWESLRSAAPRTLTLAGCLIVPEGPGTALVCREPAACEGLRPLTSGPALWDRRWRVVAEGPWPEAVRLGALGEPGLAALRALAGTGDWTPPPEWAAAPRAARLTTPALWGGSEPPGLLAAPAAGFVARQAGAAGCRVTAEPVARPDSDLTQS